MKQITQSFFGRWESDFNILLRSKSAIFAYIIKIIIHTIFNTNFF